MKTNFSKLKDELAERFSTLINDFETDIESGIKEGIYSEEDNVENRKFIKETKEMLEQFIKYHPAVYIYVEGGMVQGASVSENDFDLQIFDKDNYDAAPDEYDITPDEWDNMIKEKTENGDVIGMIY